VIEIYPAQQGVQNITNRGLMNAIYLILHDTDSEPKLKYLEKAVPFTNLTPWLGITIYRLHKDAKIPGVQPFHLSQR
jgi:hypothetical protein